MISLTPKERAEKLVQYEAEMRSNGKYRPCVIVCGEWPSFEVFIKEEPAKAAARESALVLRRELERVFEDIDREWQKRMDNELRKVREDCGVAK